ncbi:BRCA1-associated protein-like [Mizuhopecten yessoensis]|uniref:BRCA1-associated protein n=1 Tax=Mizuhopecten yessoensis TaxID=6573 RepID=A0A210Q828_MIZYE|nr:BRCA1-associated protein-like [Mizuhopecten yessoensis]OWF44883.1 BRCA1-associated protein [Mizuhopecten yessoensis]
MSKSIYLVWLRFEITGTKEGLEYIQYLAPGYSLNEESEQTCRKTYAESLSSSSSSQEREDNPQIKEDLIKECQGNRKFADLTIETYYYENMEENKEEKTYLHANRGREGSDSPDVQKQMDRKSSSREPELTRSREGSESSTASVSGANKMGPKEAYFRPIRSYMDEGPGPAPSPPRLYGEDGPGPAPSPTGGSNSRPGSGRRSHSPSARYPATIHFYSGNPAVECIQGVLHLYKDNKPTPVKGDHLRSELICMLSVPGGYTVHDLLKFTAPVSEGIEYFRIIRDPSPNQFMVLVKFRSQDQADEFFTTYNNSPYNSIEPDICHLIYVARVETVKESEGACLPTPGVTELPCCPVCLERMDESVDGVLTILCNHAFHTKCLEQWGDTSCPVCRYSQTPEESANHRCMKCSSQESLWICLICGHIGCGRYVGLHAYKHFQETQHTYSMQLGHNQVWDYAGDNYVHRLVQSKGDGKLVQVGEGGSSQVQGEKLDSLSLEYTYLLTSQLESQRFYFEEKMNFVEQEALDRIQLLEKRHQENYSEYQLVQQMLADTRKEKQGLEKKSSNLHSRLTKTLKELQEECEMNKCLQENQVVWQKRVETLEGQVRNLSIDKEKEIQELREQLRDVMFYLEAQQQLASTTAVSQEEIQEGQVVVGATGSAPSPSHKRGRKKDR